MFASALAIALSRDHDAPGAFAADISSCQAQIDQPEDILDPLGMMLQSAGVQCKSALGFGKPVSSFLNRFRRNSSNASYRCRVPRFRGLRYSFEARRVLVDEGSVLKPVTHDDMHHAEKNGE